MNFTTPTEDIVSETGIKAAYYPDLNLIASEWSMVVPSNYTFLQTAYLKAVEAARPDNMETGYILFRKEDHVVGVALLEIMTISGKNITNVDPNTKASIGYKAVRWYADRVSAKLAILGSALLSGMQGYYFDTKKVEEEEGRDALHNALEFVKRNFRKRKEKISVFMLKDIGVRPLPTSSTFIKKGYNDFSFQASMLLNMRPNWTTFEDYLGDMTSKYRVRMKRAIKAGKDFVKKELSLEEINYYREEITYQYQAIESQADFSLCQLDAGYFYQLKKQLGDKFILTAYFLEAQFVGFYTIIKSEEEAEAHLIGFDSNLNRSHHIYLNMLLDMVKIAIELGAKQLGFARTAMEIKSSIGAEPVDYKSYMRHTNCLLNLILPQFIQILEPKVEWKQRHPFKSN